MKYFEGLSEEKEIKQRYKELAKKYHPDLGGDKEIMQAINAQYTSCMEGHYQRAGKSISEIDELMKNDENARKALMQVLLFEGIKIELCGSWIWITGQTKEVKENLKSAGYRWAAKKKAWYWRPAEQAFKRKCGSRSLSWIRDRYGSDDIKASKSTSIYINN